MKLLTLFRLPLFVIITVLFAFNLCAFGTEKEIIIEEGYACMGDDKSRNQTEQEAILSAKRNALAFSYAYISSNTIVQDLSLVKDIISATSLANVRILQTIEKAWVRDSERGECFKIKVKAEIQPDKESIKLINQKYLDTEVKTKPWKLEKVKHFYPMLTKKEEKKLHRESAPFPEGNDLHWIRQKDFLEQPDRIKTALAPFSLTIDEHGFKLLEVIKNINGTNYDKITLGWKLKIYNKTKHDVWAYAGYALYDEDDYILVSFENDWDNYETGTLLKAGTEVVMKGIGEWTVPTNSNPHPLDRAKYGDYKLFLRHSMFLEVPQ